MKYCQHCGKEVYNDAVVCVHCGRATGYKEDKYSIGLNILSFFIPIVGLILCFVLKRKTPVRASGCGVWAFLGFVVNLFLTFAFTA